jgi:hypothetical protein
MDLEKMTDDQLQSRIDFHISTVDMFERRGLKSTARDFRELAAPYQAELNRRVAAKAAEVWNDPDR